MYFLAIESSCDETSITFLELEKKENSLHKTLNKTKIISSVISSQIKIHAQYGGVIPEIGARSHAEQIHFLFEEVLQQAIQKTGLDKLTLLAGLEKIFVTTQPGLASALKVGLEFAKSLQYFINKKTNKKVEIVKINHLHGHISSCFYHPEDEVFYEDEEVFPHLHLLVSGGNTQLILLKSPSDYEIIGKTLDDAAGESFDKIGRMLGFPYPGGVYLAKTAGLETESEINLPVSMLNKQLNFSYSGLKTSARNFLEKQPMPKDFAYEKKLLEGEIQALLENNLSKVQDDEVRNKLTFIKNFSISAQNSITSQLINKLKLAIEQNEVKSLGMSGGVSANQLLRKKVSELSVKKIFISPLPLTGDNAVMIGLSGIWKEIYNL